jgi:PD-(D/E)XK nuclease superfamily
MFNHVQVNLPSLLQENTDGTRLYVTPDGARYPSVTTVLGSYGQEAIQAWRQRVGEKQADKISKSATTRGTAVHAAIEDYLNNKTVDFTEMMPVPKSIFHKMKSALDKVNNIHCIEQRLFSHELKLAGTVDCIAEYDGKLSVIDWKTSTRLKKKVDIENYFMQCSAYSQMFEEMTGLKIEQNIVLIGVESAPFPQLMKSHPSEYREGLLKYVSDYYAKTGD